MSRHPSYGQSLLKLGIPPNDPIVELGVVWASGSAASSRLIRQAILSAEYLRHGRDKRLARVAGSIINKLELYFEEAKKGEASRQFQHGERSLTSHKNPSTRRNARPNENEIPTQIIKRVRKNPRTRRNARPNENEIPTQIIKRVRKNPRTSRVRAKAIERLESRLHAGGHGGSGRGAMKARLQKADKVYWIARDGKDAYYREWVGESLARNPGTAAGRRNRKMALTRGFFAVQKRKNLTRAQKIEKGSRILERLRRNPAISAKDAAAMCRVLRDHGYTCTKKRVAKRRSKSKARR